jgi:hypothetical protein
MSSRFRFHIGFHRLLPGRGRGPRLAAIGQVPHERLAVVLAVARLQFRGAHLRLARARIARGHRALLAQACEVPDRPATARDDRDRRGEYHVERGRVRAGQLHADVGQDPHRIATMLTRREAAEEVYEWVKTVRFLVAPEEQLRLDGNFERAAVFLLHEVAMGNADAWDKATTGARGVASALLVDFLAKLMDLDPEGKLPSRFDPPRHLRRPDIGGWIVAHEIERNHPWLLQGEAPQ